MQAAEAKDRLAAKDVEIQRLRALIQEVVGKPGDYIGTPGAKHATSLCSYLAEIGWFDRARAALTS